MELQRDKWKMECLVSMTVSDTRMCRFSQIRIMPFLSLVMTGTFFPVFLTILLASFHSSLSNQGQGHAWSAYRNREFLYGFKLVPLSKRTSLAQDTSFLLLSLTLSCPLHGTLQGDPQHLLSENSHAQNLKARAEEPYSHHVSVVISLS